ALQIGAGDRNDLADRVVLDADRASELVLASAGEDVDLALHVVRDGGQRGGGVRAGRSLDQAELKNGGGLDDVLHARRIVDTGELDDDAVAALRGDDRLCDAEGVDAVADRLDGVL